MARRETNTRRRAVQTEARAITTAHMATLAAVRQVAAVQAEARAVAQAHKAVQLAAAPRAVATITVRMATRATIPQAEMALTVRAMVTQAVATAVRPAAN